MIKDFKLKRRQKVITDSERIWRRGEDVVRGNLDFAAEISGTAGDEDFTVEDSRRMYMDAFFGVGDEQCCC